MAALEVPEDAVQSYNDWMDQLVRQETEAVMEAI